MVKRNKRKGLRKARTTTAQEEAAIDKTEQPGSPLLVEEQTATRTAQRQDDSGVQRVQTLQRLVTAIRSGDFDTDIENSASEGGEAAKARARQTKPKRRQQPRRRSQRGRAAHGDGASDGDEVDNDAKEQQLKKNEQKLILKFKGTGRSEIAGPRLEDIDWSEFDLDTINAILARREALRRRRRREAGEDVESDEAAAPAKLKRSSLAPAPLHLSAAKRSGSPLDEGEIVEDADVVLASATVAESEVVDEAEEEADTHSVQMEVDVDGNQQLDNELFGDGNEVVPRTPSGTLQLPPRQAAMDLESSEDAVTNAMVEAHSTALLRSLRLGRSNILRTSTEGYHASGLKDMRLILQQELKREEALLKDLRAEIVDKISKLATEEKLLRMVVKHDFELGGDDHEEDVHAPEAVFSGFGEADVMAQQSGEAGQGGNDLSGGELSAEGGSSDSDDSLSGMSSSSSDDEVQDEEVTRGALSRVLTQYLPSAEVD
ncbi:hypothetical protein H4R26_003178 [Coemansia thaxteri]|uniref:Uncharacterized protein n=1 Tax=Coemansia thaxteri TaxID=2663907 RepID=A0A9W8EJF4_9FUNG|nr:hypothetical protein H4R26_003178 [Coemansia thaxteri]